MAGLRPCVALYQDFPIDRHAGLGESEAFFELHFDADDLLDSTLMKLFSSNISAVELIKQKDIYQMLETVTDKCEDVANVIESIIIKYS